MSYETIHVEFQGPVCQVRFDRPAAHNAINARLVAECHAVLDLCEPSVTVVVLSGSAEVFCSGADFKEVGAAWDGGPGPLYDLWLRLALGPFVSLAHVRGSANAGGLGFVAASDVVLSDESARFGLSELLFGLYPACVLPFLTRRVGFQRAHYLTLSTQPVSAAQARDWGLVDACEPTSEALVRRHLQRLRRLSKVAIRRYKDYAGRLAWPLREQRAAALAGNREVFEDQDNQRAIARYVERGLLPWETE